MPEDGAANRRVAFAPMLVLAAAVAALQVGDAGAGDEECVEEGALERLKVTASYRSSGAGRIKVTAASVRVGPRDGNGSAAEEPARAGEREFVYEPGSRDHLRRRVSDRRIAVAAFHEAQAFEQIGQLLVIVPCGEPEKAVVAEHGFSVAIGRSFLYALEHTGQGRWMVIGRNHGGDGGSYWGSVWVAEIWSGGEARVRSMLKYSSSTTGAVLDPESYRYDTETDTVELELMESRPGSESAPTGDGSSGTMTLAIPLGAASTAP